MCARNVLVSSLWRNVCVLLIVVAFVAPVLQPNTGEADGASGFWLPPVVVDPGYGVVGEYSSIALVAGNPAISYYDGTDGVPKYIRATDADGTTWGTPVILDSTGGIPAVESFAVINGRPAIAYVSFDGGMTLKFVRAVDATGTVWGDPVDVVAPQMWGSFVSLAVIDGKPAVSYYGSPNKVMYVRSKDADGTSWNAPVAVGGTGLGYPGSIISLADAQGKPAIAYVLQADFVGPGQLHYIQASDADGTAWGTPAAVSPSGDDVNFFSLHFVNNYPALSYSTDAGQLKFAHAADANGAVWPVPKTLEDGGAELLIGIYNRLAVIAGKPAISYRAGSDGALKYIQAQDAGGTIWLGPVVVDDTPGGGDSLIEVSGRPAIAYKRFGKAYSLAFARASDAGGASWPVPVVLDQRGGSAGEQSSLADVNGKPAIAYFDGLDPSRETHHLKFVRAKDALGTSWGAPIVVNSEDGSVSQSPITLAIVNHRPALCYSTDLNPSDLKFVQAKDIDGDTWGTPVTAQAESNASNCTMLTIEGKPVISYASSGDLKIVMALDADGASWDDAFVVEGQTNISEIAGTPSLAVVNGKPAVSYLESTHGISQNRIRYDLKYVQALDAGAAHWGVPVIIDTAETIQVGPGIWVSGYISGINLNVVDGRPVIAYTRSVGGYTNVRYVRAEDADGKTWPDPGVAAPDTNPVMAVALSIVNGSPAISFMDSTDNEHGNLRYVQAKDAAGAEWEMPVLLDDAAKWGGISMAVIHSKPAISYHGSLRYIAAGPVNLYLPLCRK